MNKVLTLIPLVPLALAACAPDTPTPVPPAEEATEAVVDGTPTPSAEPDVESEAEPGDGLPDLAFGDIRFQMEGHTPGYCVEAYGARSTLICVENRGAGDAGPFVVTGGLTEWAINELLAGQEICRSESGSPQQVMIDADEQVDEADETNNSLILPVPTPPPLCTPGGSSDSASDSASDDATSESATQEPTEEATDEAGDGEGDDSLVGVACDENGGVVWTGPLCVCPGVIDIVTICTDGLQIDTLTDEACTPDIPCDDSGDGNNGSSGEEGGGDADK